MTAAGSLKMVGKPQIVSLPERLAKVDPFSRGEGLETPDPAGCVTPDRVGDRLLLAPSRYWVVGQGIVTLQLNRTLTLRIVVGTDPRFVGPLTVVPADAETDRMIGEVVNAMHRSVIPERKPTPKPFSLAGLVLIPDGCESVPVELWAEYRSVQGEGDVTFIAAELTAIKL